ncbi:hypothetical protein V513_08780 [Mesotoga sp. H07.pep.5.3]|nr:hypothetical protein V513_08780 [Mesotoga sp. H07.pep.5.3]
MSDRLVFQVLRPRIWITRNYQVIERGIISIYAMFQSWKMNFSALSKSYFMKYSRTIRSYRKTK